MPEGLSWWHNMPGMSINMAFTAILQREFEPAVYALHVVMYCGIELGFGPQLRVRD